MIDGLRRRDPDALAELLATHGRELQAVAYLILRDRAAAEDIVVETLLTALERANSLRDDRALRAWLLRVATNKALSVRRSSARIVRLRVVPDRESHDSTGRVADRLALMTGLEDLSPQIRAAVILRYFADLSVPEIATTLGKSVNTIKSQLRVALRRLRLALDDRTDSELPEVQDA